MKSIRNILSRDREAYRIPKSVRDYIPIDAVYIDGIFRNGNNYSVTYRFLDVNYQMVGEDNKEELFRKYMSILNAIDNEATTQITISNKKITANELKRDFFFPEDGSALQHYKDEYNQLLADKVAEVNHMTQEKLITVSVTKESIEEAREYFVRISERLKEQFATIGSTCEPLTLAERMRIFHDFYRPDESEPFPFSLADTERKGHDAKDYLAPDSMERFDDCIKLGEKYVRVLFLKEYASAIDDKFFSELTSIPEPMMLSMTVNPIPYDEAIREVQNRLLGINTNITNWQRKQNENQNFTASVPFEMNQQKEETEDFLNDLTNRNQLMMVATLTVAHMADSKKQLDRDTANLQTIAKQHLCQLAVLKFQQTDGLNTALPFAMRKIQVLRTLTSEALAVFMPFCVKEICEPGGIYYGQNTVSKHLILSDRRRLQNGNSFILGVSGSGKSFAAKNEIASLMLQGKADIIIIDPEREYGPLVKSMGGQVIDISAVSKNHINAMDLTEEYGDDTDPVVSKSEFMLSLCEELTGNGSVGPLERSIIDRCTVKAYQGYKKRGFKGKAPTLKEFRAELLKQPEPEAQDIALALELFTDGSLNTFAKQTNVDVENRLICYDILELGKQLQSVGMLVILDSILNRISANRAKGKATFIFIDEIYLLFQHEYSARFLSNLWKRVRKCGAFATGITQNVDDLLESHIARTMLANSEFVLMLNQAPTDRMKLAELLHIDSAQLSHITNVESGRGLMKIGSDMIPFLNHFPKDTDLYKLMSTKPSENLEA